MARRQPFPVESKYKKGSSFREALRYKRTICYGFLVFALLLFGQLSNSDGFASIKTDYS